MNPSNVVWNVHRGMLLDWIGWQLRWIRIPKPRRQVTNSLLFGLKVAAIVEGIVDE